MGATPGKQPQPIVYVVDDDNGVRRALTTLLSTIGYRTITFASPTEFLSKFDPDEHACLVLDVRMPEMSGLEVQRQLNHSGWMVPVILITGHGDSTVAVQAMNDGAFDYLQKPVEKEELLDRIRRALQQDAENRESVQRHAELRQRARFLTPREREVMAMVVDGRANKVIAHDLGLNERTVEIHRGNVMKKMAASSVAHLVKMHLLLDAEG